MHVVVVGCGRVGSTLALVLEQRGHSVAILDKEPLAFRRLSPEFGGEKIVGYGFDQDALAEAGIGRAEAFAAVTNGDNSNILSARVARDLYGIERVVARIYDPRRASIYQRLGIHTVATAEWTTDQVMRRLLANEYHVDFVEATGHLCIVERDLPPRWIGHKLAVLDRPGRFQVVGITRLGSATLANPDLVGQEGDVLLFAAQTDALDELNAHLETGEVH